MDVLGLGPVFWLKADVCAARLEIRKVGTAGNLQPTLLACCPYFEVKLLRVREAYVSSAYRKHSVGELELLKYSFGVKAQLFEFRHAGIGMNPFY